MTDLLYIWLPWILAAALWLAVFPLIWKCETLWDEMEKPFLVVMLTGWAWIVWIAVKLFIYWVVQGNEIVPGPYFNR